MTIGDFLDKNANGLWFLVVIVVLACVHVAETFIVSRDR